MECQLWDMTRENADIFKYEEEGSVNAISNFELELSNDEISEGNKSEPYPNDIIDLFERIVEETVLELEWKTPGKRPPTPEIEYDRKNLEGDNHEGDIGEVENTDFDFEDEMSSFRLVAKSIRPSGSDAVLKGSAKKKTTSLDSILSNMARHRKMDMMEDEDYYLLP